MHHQTDDLNSDLELALPLWRCAVFGSIDMVLWQHSLYIFGPLLQFRKALRRPRPTERDYLERQYTGIGLQLGKHSRFAFKSPLYMP